MTITGFFIILTLSSAVCALAKLAWIDLKTYTLPNGYILTFIGCGFLFHLLTLFEYVTLPEAILGGFIGWAMLFFIRRAADAAGFEDALGMGDVKLMLGAGIWLGPHYILIAMIVGALAGVLHGLFMRLIQKSGGSLALLSVPAGPGFIVGIVGTMVYVFRTLPEVMG